MGEMKIIDSAGDTKLIWDKDNRDETAAARKMFNDLKEKGFTAFAVRAERSNLATTTRL